MSLYSEEELKKSVYYPACGTDLRPILEFSNKSNLFIYVDNGFEEWSIPNNEFMQRQQQRELSNADTAKPECFEDIFKPATPEELTERNSNGNDYGLKGRLYEALEELNNSIAPGFLSFDDGRDVSELVDIDYEGFFASRIYDALNDQEKASSRRSIGAFWAREFIIKGKLNNMPIDIKFLYIASEGIVTYCSLFNYGAISPRILVTIQSGMNSVGRFDAPNGIFSRILATCNQQPLCWVRGGSGNIPDAPDCLYNIMVEEYTNCWEGVAAFRQNNEEIY